MSLDSIRVGVLLYNNIVHRRKLDSISDTAINKPGMFHDPHKHMEIFADLPSIKHNVDFN